MLSLLVAKYLLVGRVQEPPERLPGHWPYWPSRERLPERLFWVPGLHRYCQRGVSGANQGGGYIATFTCALLVYPCLGLFFYGWMASAEPPGARR